MPVVFCCPDKNGDRIYINFAKRQDRQKIVEVLATKRGYEALQAANETAKKAEAEILENSDFPTMEILLLT